MELDAVSWIFLVLLAFTLLTLVATLCRFDNININLVDLFGWGAAVLGIIYVVGVSVWMMVTLPW